MAVDRGEVFLRDRFSFFRERDVGFLVGVPRSPAGKAGTVGIAEFGEVDPVGLNDFRKLEIGCVEGEPTEASRLERVEYVGKFEGMKCTEVRFAFAGDRAAEEIDVRS